MAGIRLAAHSIWSSVMAGLLVACPQPAGPVSWLDRCFAAAPVSRVELPERFREVSGLALAADGRIFLHNDEAGAIATLDPTEGQLVATYQLGPDHPEEDFEGIAIEGDSLTMITSRGRLYRTGVPGPGPAEDSMLTYTVAETDLGRDCEIEGLAADQGVLLIACKEARRKSLGDALTIFRWDLATGELASPDRIQVPLDSLAGIRRFRASAVERHPTTGRLVVLAAADGAVAELGPGGEQPVVRALPRGHRQAEGLAIPGDGQILIADEGAPSGRGVLSRYACR